jgi:hypothetical protein
MKDADVLQSRAQIKRRKNFMRNLKFSFPIQVYTIDLKGGYPQLVFVWKVPGSYGI